MHSRAKSLCVQAVHNDRSDGNFTLSASSTPPRHYASRPAASDSSRLGRYRSPLRVAVSQHKRSYNSFNTRARYAYWHMCPELCPMPQLFRQLKTQVSLGPCDPRHSSSDLRTPSAASSDQTSLDGSDSQNDRVRSNWHAAHWRCHGVRREAIGVAGPTLANSLRTSDVVCLLCTLPKVERRRNASTINLGCARFSVVL